MTKNSSQNVRTPDKAIVKSGSFFRKSDKALIQRYICSFCRRSFSTATRDLCFKQHKRNVNHLVAKLLVSGCSLRRAALILKINRKTVVRKLIFLGTHAQSNLTESNLLEQKCHTIEFDDLETVEHTKLKPLSVTLVVEHNSRRILGFNLAKMPAKGLLAKKSLKKYGFRKDERPRTRKELFKNIKPMILDGALIKSDSNPHYIKDVKDHFPNCVHQTHLSRRGSVTGQGELKKIVFDPLFSLNHTCAMLRANINRLFRKTWCTTKKPDRLGYHIALYAVFHNKMVKKAS